MRVLYLLCSVAMLAHAAHPDATAADVVDAVTTGIWTKTDDAVIAGELKKLQLRERLTDETVGFLSAQTIGPETLKALEQVAKKSARLAVPTTSPVSIDPAPAAKQFQQILAKVSQYVAHYTRSLPDFTCDEITRRFTNFFTGKGVPDRFDPVRFRQIDTLRYGLRFTGGHDHATLLTVNGKSTNRLLLSAGQSFSTGEFGEDMQLVIGPASGAIFEWSRWQTLSGVGSAVFTYTVGPAHTRFQISYCCLKRGDKEYQQFVISPVEGLLYVDPQSGEILRIMLRPIQLPDDFEIDDTRTVIDYRPVLVANHSYRLPVGALTYMQTRGGQRTRNKIAFTNYKKFDAESVLLLTNSKITYKTEKKQ